MEEQERNNGEGWFECEGLEQWEVVKVQLLFSAKKSNSNQNNNNSSTNMVVKRVHTQNTITQHMALLVFLRQDIALMCM